MKSLGLESDCIGWCTLKPRVDESIVKQIYQKAKEEKVRILAKYELNLTKNYPTDWYILTGKVSRKYTNAIKDRIIDLEDDFCIVQRISGYKIEPSDRILAGKDFLMFQKSVVDFLKENEINDLDYMWVEDFGKYRATPYFFAMPKAFLTWCFDDEMYDLHKGRGKKEMSNQICAFGKKIELIWKKSKVLRMNFPIMVRRQELQGRDIWGFGRELLVSKKVRDLLLGSKLVRKENFVPVLVSDRERDFPPKGLEESSLEEYYIPEEIQEEYRKLYEKDLLKKKPQYIMTHKKVFATLKRVKKMDKEFYSKPLPVKKLDILMDDRLTELYRISNGGCFSSEYFYYAAEELEKINKEFNQEMKLEELVEVPEGSVVFGGCADGEYILLLPNNTVARYQVGENSFETQWRNLDDFIYEAIMEEE